MRTSCAPFARRRISIHEFASSKKATCSNASGLEVRAEPVVHHAEHVAVELGRDALAVVVGGLQHAAVLDEVGADQQPVVGQHQPSQPGEERRRARRGRGCRSCRRGRRPAGRVAVGHALQVALEVADHAVHLEPRVQLDQLGGAALDRRLRHVDRDVAPQRALRPPSAYSSARVFARSPEPSSTSSAAPRVARRSRARAGSGSRARRASGSTRAAS